MISKLINRLLGRSQQNEDIEALYLAVVAEARQPGYYSAPYSVPNSLDGRFEMLVLVAQLVLRRLSNRVDGGDAEVEAAQHALAKRRNQRLFDRVFAGFDRELREIGMGDHSVPKQIQKMADSFFGRGQAYEAALDRQADPSALAKALTNNLYGSISDTPPTSEAVDAMAQRVRQIVEDLRARADADVMAGRWDIPKP